MISIESFIHLINLLMNKDEVIDLNHIPDLFHLCDKYLIDYLPYRLVHYVLEQFINGITINIVEMVSKPKLVSSLIRAFFSHLLTSDTNISIKIFSELMSKYFDELQTLVISFFQRKCWFRDEYSPFLSRL